MRTDGLSRCLTGLLVALALLAGPLGTPAAAEPRSFETLVMSCDGLGQIATVSPGNGLLTPAFVQGTHQLLVIWAISLTTEVDGAQDAALAKSRQASPPDDSFLCAFDQTYHFGDHAIRVVGTATVVPVAETRDEGVRDE